MPRTSLLVLCGFALALPALCQTTAVIDTTVGRITCTLLTRERPATTARFIALAEGKEAWTLPDGKDGTGTPFYDGTQINPASAGIATGGRQVFAQKPAAEFFAAETTPPILFDQPGLLAMSIRGGKVDPARLLITDHGNREVDGHAVAFGLCNAASARLAGSLRHTLQSTDNHPAPLPLITHVAVVAAGKPLPPKAAFPHTIFAGLMPRPLSPPSGPAPDGPTAILVTTAGRIACRLFTKESPVATSAFLGLVDGTKDWTDPRTQEVQHGKRFYDGMAFDRVLPDYYIQFGDITGDISGKVDIGFRFPNENTPGLTFDRPGRLAFGNGGKDTNNSELFFALNPMHALDNGYTIIGQCDAASLAVLDRIAHLPRNASNLPLTPVVIRRIDVKP